MSKVLQNFVRMFVTIQVLIMVSIIPKPEEVKKIIEWFWTAFSKYGAIHWTIKK